MTKGPDKLIALGNLLNAGLPADECWEFAAGPKGYGYVYTGYRAIRAHRYAYEACVGPIPAGMHILHACDNPPCVNPAHLFLGTHAENMADMKAKGRGRSGNTRLTDDQVAEIKRRRAAGERCASIAPDFGISSAYVGQLANGVWRERAV